MLDPVVLVVGASGQLGSAVVRKLRARSIAVRALVRPDSRAGHLETLGVEIRKGDLLDPASLSRACDGADFVVATATAALPRKSRDTFRSVDVDGYRALIDACRHAHVRRFVYVSVCSLPGESSVPLFRAKRAVEECLGASGVPFTILRAAAFMDLVFAMMGSDIPLRGEEAPSAARPFWFTRKFFDSVRNDLDRGRLGVTGDGATRHSFIAVNDVAEFAVRSLRESWTRDGVFEIGGPRPVSQREVAEIYSRILGRPLRVRSTPRLVFQLMQAVLGPFSEAAANIAAINLLSATHDGIVPGAAETAAKFGVRLTSAEQFLGSKAALAPESCQGRSAPEVSAGPVPPPDGSPRDR